MPLTDSQRLVLTEGSVFELLRRDPAVRFDREIAHAGLIYDDVARERLASVHADYLAIGRAHALPMIAWADTWRASGPRIARSPFAGRDVNGDSVRFLRELAGASGADAAVGALTGPAGDAYDPAAGLSYEGALAYHDAQIAALAAAGAELIVGATLPAFGEARAIAKLLAESGVAWMVSFVVRGEGTMLDGTPLERAIETIESEVARPPIGFSINCTHSTAARSAIRHLAPAAASRVIALQANTSSRSPEELDGLDHVETEAPEVFAKALAELADETSIRIVGGCCGSDARHIDALAARLATAGGAGA